jgi:hypothetical protein
MVNSSEFVARRIQTQGGQCTWLAAQLQIHRIKMRIIDMGVIERYDQPVRDEAGYLCQQMQCRDVAPQFFPAQSAHPGDAA